MNRPSFQLTMIDDDRNFMQVLSLALEDAFSLKTFSSPGEGIHYLSCNKTDGVLLDLHMPDITGFEVCQQIRQIKSDLPVFFLTSDDEVASIERGLNMGAIDYLMKNTPPSQIAARLKARLTTIKRPEKVIDHLSYGDLSLNLASQQISINGSQVVLTPKETEIVKFFLEHPERIYSKQQLVRILWPTTCVDPNNIDTHMFHLRRKLTGKTRIQTRKGLGYILRTET